jgi:hypothetical protein
VLNVVTDNLFVSTDCPFRLIEPVIDNEPVTLWVSVIELPNWVEPDSKRTEELTIDMCNSSAVSLPRTVRSCSKSAEPDTTRPFLILNSFAIIY